MRPILLSALISSLLSAFVTALVFSQLRAPIAEAQAPRGPLIVEGGIYVTKNGAPRAAITVDDKQRAQLILYGAPGTIGLGPLADYIQQAGIAVVDTADAALVLTASNSGATLNLAGGPSVRSNVVIDTGGPGGPSITLYKVRQTPTVELNGATDGNASISARGSFSALDADGNAAWQAP